MSISLWDMSILIENCMFEHRTGSGEITDIDHSKYKQSDYPIYRYQAFLQDIVPEHFLRPYDQNRDYD